MADHVKIFKTVAKPDDKELAAASAASETFSVSKLLIKTDKFDTKDFAKFKAAMKKTPKAEFCFSFDDKDWFCYFCRIGNQKFFATQVNIFEYYKSDPGKMTNILAALATNGVATPALIKTFKSKHP